MKALAPFAILALVLAVAAATNPSPTAHREKIRQGTAERSPLAGVLGAGHVSAFVSEYHSAGLVSWTKVGEDTMTVGAFGIVVLTD